MRASVTEPTTTGISQFGQAGLNIDIIFHDNLLPIQMQYSSIHVPATRVYDKFLVPEVSGAVVSKMPMHPAGARGDQAGRCRGELYSFI
jgi:hypothetical protein